MSSAFEVYKDYVALKNHFSTINYDYLKYNGKTGLKQSSFNSRKDKIFFEKLAKNPEYHDFLIANLSHNHKLWIRELSYSDEAEKRFTEWKKRQQSLTYLVKSELSQLKEKFDDNFICENNKQPFLLRLYLGNSISLETLCILLNLTGAMKHWDSKMEYDPVWDEMSLKVKKYTPFIKYDSEKIKKIVIDFFS